MKPTLYAVGFLFSEDRKAVALIRKNRPEWQKGKLNGVGGHAEPGEQSIDTMRREFREETGVSVIDWTWYLQIQKSAIYAVDVYCAFGSLNALRTMTDEPIEIVAVDNLPSMPDQCVPNLSWLIFMALCKPFVAKDYVVTSKWEDRTWHD